MTTRLQPFLVAAAVTLGVLALAVWGDRYAAHGLTAEWRQAHEGETMVVARTVEHRTTFPNEHRALSRYIQAWPFDAWGMPDERPALDARLTGRLRVPGPAPRYLRAEGPNETHLRVDGREVGPSDPVSPGVHDLTVVWKGRFDGRTRLEPTWSTRPGSPSFEPIPATAFTPANGPWTPLRTGLWVAAVLLAAGLAFLAHRAALASVPSVRRRRWGLLAALVVVLLTVGYRSFDYTVMPEFRENYDELFATWNGWSLLAEGTPRGWSLWPGRYAGQDGVHIESLSYFGGRPFSVVEPYFEHPPLLHLLAGAAAHVGGASHWAHARLTHTRWVPIALSAVTVWLLIAVGRRLDPKTAAPYLGGLLYAVLPIIALQGRVIKEEALLAPMALGSLLLYLRWRDDGERRAPLVGAAVLAGAATMAKMTGLIFVVALVMLVLARGRPREAILAGAVGLAATSPLLVYAAAIDWDVFWYATVHQATGRPSHWNLFPRFFDDPLINHNLVGRPWLLFLWLGWALSLRGFAARDRAVLTVPPLLYILGIGLSSGNWTFGWYLMPVYPFLCIGAGRFLADLWNRPDLLRGTLFVTLAVMYGVNFIHDTEAWRAAGQWPETRRAVTIFLVLALAPYALVQVSRARAFRSLARLATAAGLAGLIGLSGWFVARYDVIYETHENFDRLEFFDR
ncbi:MAG: ArnT family glycosyltransferase [Myxococcota bacterium]